MSDELECFMCGRTAEDFKQFSKEDYEDGYFFRDMNEMNDWYAWEGLVPPEKRQICMTCEVMVETLICNKIQVEIEDPGMDEQRSELIKKILTEEVACSKESKESKRKDQKIYTVSASSYKNLDRKANKELRVLRKAERKIEDTELINFNKGLVLKIQASKELPNQ